MHTRGSSVGRGRVPAAAMIHMYAIRKRGEYRSQQPNGIVIADAVENPSAFVSGEGVRHHRMGARFNP